MGRARFSLINIEMIDSQCLPAFVPVYVCVCVCVRACVRACVSDVVYTKHTAININVK